MTNLPFIKLAFYLENKYQANFKKLSFIRKANKKNVSHKNGIIDLSHLKELSYSAVMRELRKQCNEETVREFLIIFKKIFDALILQEASHPADKAMPATLIIFGKNHRLELNND